MNERYVNQFEFITRKFGGARKMRSFLIAAGIKIGYTTVYRWNYPKSKGGNDGVIPFEYWRELQAIARIQGIMLLWADFEPKLRRNSMTNGKPRREICPPKRSRGRPRKRIRLPAG